MSSKKTMEVNPTNSIISALWEKANTDQSDKTEKDLIWLHYDTSLLTSGFSLEEPATFLLEMNFVLRVLAQSHISLSKIRRALYPGRARSRV